MESGASVRGAGRSGGGAGAPPAGGKSSMPRYPTAATSSASPLPTSGTPDMPGGAAGPPGEETVSPESHPLPSLATGWTGAALISAGLALALAIILFEVLRSGGAPGAWAPILAGTVVGVGLMLIGFLLHLQSLIATFERRSSARHRELAESHRELARRVERLHALHAARPDSRDGAGGAAVAEGTAAGEFPPRAAPAAAAAEGGAEEREGAAGPEPAGRCPVCSTELRGGRCERCETSSEIQSAYLEVSRVQSAGAGVEEAASLLASARECLERGQYDEARKFVRSALHFAEASAGRHRELSARLRTAEDGVLSLRASADTAGELSALRGMLLQARRELGEGLYDEAEGTLDRILRAVEALAREPPPEAGKPAKLPRGISKCAKCGKSVLTGWAKCPYCLAPLN